MKKITLLLMALLMFGTAQTAMAQNRKPNKRTTTTSPRKNTTDSQVAICPLKGSWYGTLGNGDGSGWGECYVFLQTEKKKDVNPRVPKQQAYGYIDISDEAYMRERNYNLQFVRTVSVNTYEFSIQNTENKKSGKMQIVRNGDQITMIGIDAWAKQQPFHNKTISDQNNADVYRE
ncbi:MAG: hypothetical protein J6I31_00865 [Prevotella sp.]|nr:hypothetical protein [Prevotella sp.]